MPPGPLPDGQHRDSLLAEVTTRLSHLDRAAVAVVACSGGRDSTALAFLAEEARPDLALTLVHVSHGLRDDDADARLVAAHAARLGVDCVHRRIEVDVDGRGLEAAARDARYAALREVADERGAATILVGHTADDQAETVLLRIARGTGIDGLGAMAPHAGDLSRPLLNLRRADVHAFVIGEGLESIHDPMNDDARVRRVVVRGEVLPALGRVAPDPVGALGRLAELARGDAEILDTVARDTLEPRSVGEAVLLERARLTGAPTPVARRLLHHVLRDLLGAAPDAATVQRVLDARPAHRSTLPGSVTCEVTRRWISLAPPPPAEPDPVPLSATTAVAWEPAARWIHLLVAGDEQEPDHGEVHEGEAHEGEAHQAALPLPGVWVPPPFTPHAMSLPPSGNPGLLEARLPPDVGSLTVRSARPGDRIADVIGRRRVVEVLRSAAVPRSVRARWPVVTAGERVVWIPGYAVDPELAARARAAPHAVLRLSHTAGQKVGARSRPRAEQTGRGGRRRASR